MRFSWCLLFRWVYAAVHAAARSRDFRATATKAKQQQTNKPFLGKTGQADGYCGHDILLDGTGAQTQQLTVLNAHPTDKALARAGLKKSQTIHYPARFKVRPGE